MRIFFDMDGTLAEWKPITLKAEEEIKEVLNQVLGQPGYYRNLNLNKNIRELMYSLMADGHEVYTLSCYRPDSYAMRDDGTGQLFSTPLMDKKDWLREHVTALPTSHQIFVPDGINKAEYLKYCFGLELKKEDILIDDFHKNLKEWTRAGGTPVKCLNGINSPDASYEQISINKDYRSPSPEYSKFIEFLNSLTRESKEDLSIKDSSHERE